MNIGLVLTEIGLRNLQSNKLVPPGFQHCKPHLVVIYHSSKTKTSES
jgi:hypothetical protein